MLIKTKVKIGKFIQNSRIDNVPIVEVNESELYKLDRADAEYEEISTIDQVLNNKKKTVVIDEKLHQTIKIYCAKNSLKMNDWIEKELEKIIIKYDIK